MKHMADAAEGEQILKTDKLAWFQVPAERREAILGEFELSGMSGAAFAKLNMVLQGLEFSRPTEEGLCVRVV